MYAYLYVLKNDDMLHSQRNADFWNKYFSFH